MIIIIDKKLLDEFINYDMTKDNEINELTKKVDELKQQKKDNLLLFKEKLCNELYHINIPYIKIVSEKDAYISLIDGFDNLYNLSLDNYISEKDRQYGINNIYACFNDISTDDKKKYLFKITNNFIIIEDYLLVKSINNYIIYVYKIKNTDQILIDKLAMYLSL